MSDFLGRWLGKGHRPNVKNLSKRTIKTDKWDEQDYEAILEQMKDFERARDNFSDEHDTGFGATADTFFSFFHMDPQKEDDNKIRPDHVVNAMVRDELWDLTEWEELRAIGTIGDDVNSALAFMTMVPELETIYDKLAQEQKLAEQLQQQIEEIQQLESEAKSLDDMIKEMQEQEEPDPDALKEAQKQQAANSKAQGKAMGKAQSTAEKLQQGLDQNQGQVQAGLRKGLDKAKDQAEAMDGVDQAWGTEPGSLQKLPVEKRIELAKRIKDNPKLKRLSELVGPMKRVMFGEQRKKADHARDEVFNVEKGNDLSRLIPQELQSFHHLILKRIFYKNLVDESLLQYELKGEERMGLGGIVCCIDDSGSMAGDREIWAKAVALSLLHLAKAQKRSFLGIHFGSAYEIAEFKFEKDVDFSLEHIFEFAELFFNGGTDFQTPLTAAVKHLRAEFDATGKVKGDIVFITDGACNVDPHWMEEFKKEQETVGFQVFGVLVGGASDYYGSPEVLKEICDNKFVTIKQLNSAEDVRDVFGRINSA